MESKVQNKILVFVMKFYRWIKKLRVLMLMEQLKRIQLNKQQMQMLQN